MAAQTSASIAAQTAVSSGSGVARLGAQSGIYGRDGEIHNADTLAWWHTTEFLSSDAMEGRDTGSAAYERAAKYVAARFKEAGLQPAGENGTYFQQVPMHEIRVTPDGTSFTLVRDDGTVHELKFLQEIDLRVTATLPKRLEAPLAFRGYCSKAEATKLTGKIAVCFGTRRAGPPNGRQQLVAVRAAGAVGMIAVDDLTFTMEPPRWPDAYARSVTLQTSRGKMLGNVLSNNMGAFVTMRLSAPAFATMLDGSGRDAAEILALGGASKPLPSFDLPARLRVKTHTVQRDISSPNVLAVLPGSDPKLRSEYVVIAAHLDGYGYGTPVQGDKIYNGALDDAAYVALIIQFAEDQQAAMKKHEDRPGVGLKRSVLFCAFTGEEKGLLGSTYFTEHPTVPKAGLVADINLDQLRPLFPLHILTALAVDDTTLGATAKAVAAPMKIAIRADREPERHMLQRADHWPFMQIGVPSIGFIFGYDPGTDAEKRYRQWYTTQYHRPQDDVTQPIDFDAATKFDAFFYALTRTVANAPVRPEWLATSPYKPRN